MTSSPWNDDRVARLERLWAEGLSASEIARRLGGVTRNAVIGKLHRLGRLGGRPRTAPPRAAVRPARTVQRARSAPNRPVPQASPEPTREPGDLVALEALGPGHCRWPIGEPQRPGFGFCGRPAPGGPYCPAHAAAAFVRPRAAGRRS